jgi:GMP synthase (glutamine-hydrolysing)
MDSIKFKLLQARVENDPVRERERNSFAVGLGVLPQQIETVDMLKAADNYDSITKDVNAVLIGGSGDFSVTADLPWLPNFFTVLGDLAHNGFPTFASCFGFQGMVKALGGKVETDNNGLEVGSHMVEKLPSGEGDPLFNDLPDTFVAQQGHADRAIELPDGVELLAQSQRCPYQAIKVNGVPVYATQFHPELTASENKRRFLQYFDHYIKAIGQEESERILSSFQDSTESSFLLQRFKNLVTEQCLQ